MVAPLDWGLGHASRCAPLIQQLINSGAEPIVGANGKSAFWLKSRFPQLRHVEIPGMEVSYSAKSSQIWAIAKQIPRFLKSISNERSTLKRLIAEYSIDAVISDQRFGLYSKDVPSIIITHQTHPITPVSQSILRKQNRLWLAAFDEVWIPDNDKKLAGKLSDKIDEPPSYHIGHLSRFQHLSVTPVSSYTCVAVISGPEPHRSILENQVVSQLESIPGEHLVLAGQPANYREQVGHVHIHGDMPDAELLPHLLGCELIIARSGYSTLMDLRTINRGALLIPTPGQPEQEYLAALHADGSGFIVQNQDDLDIQYAFGINIEPPINDPPDASLVQHLERLSKMIIK